jgi:hypothetical protein
MSLFKPLKLATIDGYHNTMPKEIHKWLPKFTGNDVVIPEDHLYAVGVALLNEVIEHEDFEMRRLSMPLNEDSQRCFRGIPDDHLASYDDFTKFIKSMWQMKKDSRMILE